MKVKELIEKLREFPPDADVVFETYCLEQITAAILEHEGVVRITNVEE